MWILGASNLHVAGVLKKLPFFIMDLNTHLVQESEKLKEDPGKDEASAGLATVPPQEDETTDKQQYVWNMKIPALTIWM